MIDSGITQTVARALYRAGNNAGRGYRPADSVTVDGAIAEIVEIGGTLVLTRVTSDDVAVVAIDGGLVAIGGDERGGDAWAVRIVSAPHLYLVRTAAGQAGDLEMVATCDRAEIGDVFAMCDVAYAIWDAGSR